MELLSEANNFGNEAIINRRVVDGDPGCYNLKAPDDSLGVLSGLEHPYKDDPDGIIPDLKAWQSEMCRYIKEDLEMNQHPMVVSYTGQPDWVNGDYTYFNNYVDIASFNHYKLSRDKFEKNKEIIEDTYHTDADAFYLNKPMMHSEYGPGNGGYTDCDNGIRYLKASILTPFTGAASSAMNWHGHLIGDDVWHYLKPIKELMEGIKLDEDNWEVGVPIVQSDKSVEVLYL